MQTFGVKKDPVKDFLEKLHFRGKIQNLGFLRKNLKAKKAYLGDFSAKNEKNNISPHNVLAMICLIILHFSDTKLYE